MTGGPLPSRRTELDETASDPAPPTRAAGPEELSLVGPGGDRGRLLLIDDAGREFSLAVDARLHAALRGDHARLGQLEITMDSALRPRDIQSRIRSGESPETVAAAAGTSVDKVMAYAVPVLAERAHVADRAQRASVRRAGGEGPHPALADAVAERLRSRSVDPEAVEWDAWRREDGRWALVADYLSGESARHAEFMFDAPGSYVVAEDDEARWLVGEQTSLRGPQPRTPGQRRLSAVGGEDELPLGEDALALVDERPTGLASVRTADADWMATQAGDRPVPGAEPEVVELGSEADDAPDDVVPAPAARPARKGKRASVPSWDEIMFGGPPQE